MGHEGPESGAIAVHDLVMVDPFITKERGRCAWVFWRAGDQTMLSMVWCYHVGICLRFVSLYCFFDVFFVSECLLLFHGKS